jgi:hypothetical protein
MFRWRAHARVMAEDLDGPLAGGGGIKNRVTRARGQLCFWKRAKRSKLELSLATYNVV